MLSTGRRPGMPEGCTGGGGTTYHFTMRRHPDRAIAPEVVRRSTIYLIKTLANSRLLVSRCHIALTEMIRDFVKCPLFPFLGLGQPEHATLGIHRGPLSAHTLIT